MFSLALVLMKFVPFLVFSCICLMSVKFSIWKVRNDLRFRDVPPGAFVVIEMVKSRVRFFLPRLFKRFKSSRRRRLFHRQWGASGVIGSVVDGRFFSSAF